MCANSPHILVAPFRPKQPAFATIGVVDVRRELRNFANLDGCIRLDLILIFKSVDVAPPVIHHFTDPDDVAVLEGKMRAVFGS